MVKKAPKATDAGAPTKPKSGYFLYAESVREQVTADIRASLKPDEKFSIVSVGKAISEKWKDVPQAQKDAYAAQFKEQSVGYKEAYAAWAKTEKGKQYALDLSSFKKQKGDTEAKDKLFAAGYPRKPMSGYLQFSADVTKAVVAELEAEGKAKSAKERSVKIKERWDAIGKAGQDEWNQKYAAAKAKYIEEKTAFEANNPAFVEYDKAVEKNKAAHAKRLREPAAKRRKVDSAEPAAEESPVDEEEEEESPEEDEEESPEE